MEKEIYVANGVTKTEGVRKVSNGRVIVGYKRVDNDVNGNPLYRVYPINYLFRRLDKSVYRNYESKGYYLLQSYNIIADLYDLMEEANRFVSVDLKEGLLEEQGYRKEKAYV